MNLFFELVQQTPVKDAGVLLFGGDDDGIRFRDAWKIVFDVRRDNTVCDSFLEDFPKFLTTLRIRPQNENGVRHFCLPDPKKSAA